jgi:hypothetical protein
MYKIIGADQKEYGPISADQVRVWIAEGRANANTQARLEGATTWQPLSAFPEFAMALGLSPAPTPIQVAAQPTVLAPLEQVLNEDYSLDIGACLTRGWELLKENFWPTVGASTLIVVLTVIINQVIGLFTRPLVERMIEERRISIHAILIIVVVGFVSAPIYTVLYAGLFKYFIKLIRRETASIGDAFSGFGPSILQLILLGWVQGILVNLGFLFCVIPGIYLFVSWYFAIPLIIDRGIGFWEAMEFSRKMVSKHWFVVFGLILVAGLLSIVGVIACCIGVLASLPFGLAALMYAYEDIFGKKAG